MIFLIEKSILPKKFGVYLQVLLLTIPAIIDVLYRPSRTADYTLMLLNVCNACLLPLLYTQFEDVTKFVLILVCIVFSKIIKNTLVILQLSTMIQYATIKIGLNMHHTLLSRVENAYQFLLFTTSIYTQIVHAVVFPQFPFIALMLQSVVCAVGVVYCYVCSVYEMVVCDALKVRG
jgi:hypothetical protein